MSRTSTTQNKKMDYFEHHKILEQLTHKVIQSLVQDFVFNKCNHGYFQCRRIRTPMIQASVESKIFFFFILHITDEV